MHYSHNISILKSTSTLTTSPANSLLLDANGTGYLEITFATTIPPQYTQYAISSNTIKIPVYGHVSLSLKGVTSVTPVDVIVQAEEHYSSLIGTPVGTSVIQKPFKTVSIAISSNSVTSIAHDGVSAPPVQSPIFYVGGSSIQFVGYGVTFTVQDYDPIAGVPAGNPTTISLTSGSSSSLAEAPSNNGVAIMRSYTGYIILSNFSGSGIVDLFLENYS